MKAFLGAALLTAAVGVYAAEAPGSDTDAVDSLEARPVHCLQLIRIKESEILDSNHIVFHMINGDTYVNTLPHACPGLRKNEPYMLRTSQSRICDLDIITMLHPNGWGFMPGASCGLGDFDKVTPEQVEMIKRAAKTKKAG
jgi:hypothetical protein